MQSQAPGRTNALLVLHQACALKHLVVFPFAGGTAASGLALSQAIGQLTDRLNVIAVNLPEQRLPQPQMASELARELAHELTGELYFYSHCAGSSLALETALQLEKLGRPPAAILIGASLPPVAVPRHKTGTTPLALVQRGFNRLLENPWRYFSDAALLKTLRAIGLRDGDFQPDQLAQIIRWFRQDATEFYAFFHRIEQETRMDRSGIRLSAPIHCIVGDQDPVTLGAKRLYKRWQLFSSQVDLTVLTKAGHYFLSSPDSELGRWILQKIDPAPGGRHD